MNWLVFLLGCVIIVTLPEAHYKKAAINPKPSTIRPSERED